MQDRKKPNSNCVNCDGEGSHGLREDGPCGLCWSYVYQTNDKAVKRDDLLEIIIGLQAALSIRNNCPDCNSSGLNWVLVDEEAEAEPCNCTIDADEIQYHYKEKFKLVIDEYLWLNGYDPKEVGKEFDNFVYGLLDKIKDTITKRERNK